MKPIKSIAIFLSIALTACASGADIANMTYQGANKTFPSEIQNEVTVEESVGGKETNPLWASQISNKSFTSALKNTLKMQGLLSDNGKYLLSTKLLSVDQPFIGINFEVTTVIEYTLTKKSDGSVIMKEAISAPYTATMSDSLIGMKRLRLANEGSAKHNIELLLGKLSDLEINTRTISLK